MRILLCFVVTFLVIESCALCCDNEAEELRLEVAAHALIRMQDAPVTQRRPHTMTKRIRWNDEFLGQVCGILEDLVRQGGKLTLQKIYATLVENLKNQHGIVTTVGTLKKGLQRLDTHSVSPSLKVRFSSSIRRLRPKRHHIRWADEVAKPK